MSRQPPGGGDGSAELQARLSSLMLSYGSLNMARLGDSDCHTSTDHSSDWTDVTSSEPTEQDDSTTDSTLTSDGGGDWQRRQAGSGVHRGRDTRRGGYGGHDFSTVYEDSESSATLRSAPGDDAASVVSRWSDFVSSDDDYLTADDGVSVSSPPPGVSPEAELLQRLRELGDDPGPVTSSTVELYRRRLARLETRAATFSPELDAALAGAAPLPPPALEEVAFGAAVPSGVATRRSCFNYLLLDPRVTSRRSTDGQLPLAAFAAAVFYVGKGQQSRPYSHLQEAAGPGSAGSAKVAHIRAVWRSGAGVALLSVFHHRPAAEALTREAAIIDALGLRNLTNVRRGDYYGPAQAWPTERRRRLGVALLHRAWRIYLVEGETRLRPEDLGR